jgi:hypothetical protein
MIYESSDMGLIKSLRIRFYVVDVNRILLAAKMKVVSYQ